MSRVVLMSSGNVMSRCGPSHHVIMIFANGDLVRSGGFLDANAFGSACSTQSTA